MHADKQGSSPAARGQRARSKLINVLANGHLLGPCAHVSVVTRQRVHVPAGSWEYGLTGTHACKCLQFFPPVDPSRIILFFINDITYRFLIGK